MPRNRKTDIISLGVPSGIAWKDGDAQKRLQIVYSYYTELQIYLPLSITMMRKAA